MIKGKGFPDIETNVGEQSPLQFIIKRNQLRKLSCIAKILKENCYHCNQIVQNKIYQKFVFHS